MSYIDFYLLKLAPISKKCSSYLVWIVKRINRLFTYIFIKKKIKAIFNKF